MPRKDCQDCQKDCQEKGMLIYHITLQDFQEKGLLIYHITLQDYQEKGMLI